jgi:hypothetical protein
MKSIKRYSLQNKSVAHALNFDIGFFAISENLVFSDNKNTKFVEKFEPEVC